MKRLLVAIAAMLLLAVPMAVSWGASSGPQNSTSSAKPFPETNGTNAPCPGGKLDPVNCSLGEGSGADKAQPVAFGDCKNPGTKSDAVNTTGNHQGYDCVPPSTPPVCVSPSEGCTSVTPKCVSPDPKCTSVTPKCVSPDPNCTSVTPKCVSPDPNCTSKTNPTNPTETPASGTAPAAGVLGASAKKGSPKSQPSGSTAPASGSVPTSPAASPVASSSAQGGLTG